MAEDRKDYWTIVTLKEQSQLKTDLNLGVASLFKAKESHFQPHICLNGLEGIEILRRIAANPETAVTSFSISEFLNYGGGSDIWLNVNFYIYLNDTRSNHLVSLSPQQTAYIIINLSLESKETVLAKIKVWYFGYLKNKVIEGLEKIDKQFNEEKFFIADTHWNRIFDIHGDGGGHDKVEYTEMGIIGKELFYKFFLGHTLFHHEQNRYERIDEMLLQMDKERKEAIEGVYGLMKALR